MELHVLPKTLPEKLLNNLDIMKAITFEKQKWMKQKDTAKEPSISRIALVLAIKVQHIYRKLNQPTIERDKLKKKIMKIYNCRQQLLKIPRLQRHQPAFLKKIRMYQQFMSESLDVYRKRYSSKRKKKKLQKNKVELVSTEDEDVSMDSDNEKDLDYEPPCKKSKIAKEKIDLTEIIEAQYRYSGSDRSTTAIVNATLRTFKIPTIIDKSKLRRSQDLQTSQVGQQNFTFGGGIYYDSRKDMSISQIKKIVEDGKAKFYRSIEREEHYTIVSQPEGLFLGSVTAKGLNSKSGSEAILPFLKNENIFDDLIVVGCDGTNVNVGGDGGINALIEKELKRPLHWFICMLHLNELPLRALITKLDGPTSSKDGFSGPIGKQLNNVGGLEVIKFKRFKNSEVLPRFPEHVYAKLSSDQKYLYRIVNALVSGHFPKSLQELKIGPLNHSRWLTAASRICKLYASTKSPSQNLQTITSYIVGIYAPMWFQIKTHDLATDGPKNLYSLMKKSNSIQDENTKNIVQRSIQRNAFFAHSENLLLAQLASENKSERSDAVHKILRIRDQIPNAGIRRFEVPDINFNARKWTAIIADDSNSTEPPITANMNEDELKSIIDNRLDVPKFKCHTQMVERGVKEVTRVSLKAIDLNKRNCMVKKTLIHRAKYPKLDSKKDHLIKENINAFLPKI